MRRSLWAAAALIGAGFLILAWWKPQPDDSRDALESGAAGERRQVELFWDHYRLATRLRIDGDWVWL